MYKGIRLFILFFIIINLEFNPKYVNPNVPILLKIHFKHFFNSFLIFDNTHLIALKIWIPFFFYESKNF